MILADKIIELRKKNGWSQEDLAEKLNVSRQSVSKWEGAQSVPDMARIVMMSDIFGVSTDYLLKDDLELPVPSSGEVIDTGSSLRTVSLEEATSFLRLREYNAPRIALGVMMCILSPILLLYLGAAQEYGKIAISENKAGGIGLLLLFVLVGCAVALFVSAGLRSRPYEYLEQEKIDTLYGVDGMVRERRDRFQPVFSRQLVIGIVLCVVAAIPLFATMIIFDGNDFLAAVSICVMLAIIAIGVFMIVRVCIIWDGFHQLLEEGDYSRSSKDELKKYGWFHGCFWMLVTAAFLAWSFITNRWDRSWIIWPVAGVAYGAIYAILKAARQKSE